ncbi:MAG: flavin reductase [Sphingobacteriia bacterium]|nr:flavin reductase [Sphingobacteriia bacterium]
MKITAIYGTERKGSTYHIARQFISGLEPNPENIREFFLPKAAPNFCRGCFACFTNNQKCPDYPYIKPILEAMEQADLLIFASPVYVYHVTGQMKAFLDHFGFQWMAHQPNETMFHKQALIITTAAGAGMRPTMKDIADSLEFWGVAKIYRYGKAVAAADWAGVSSKNKEKFECEIKQLTDKIKRQSVHIKPSLKVKGLFYLMRLMQIKFGFNPPDVAYWKEKGWLGKARPW